MKLNRFDPRSIRVQRSSDGGTGQPARGGIGGKGLGLGGIVIVLIGALVFGIDPGQMLGTLDQLQGGQAQTSGPIAGQQTADAGGRQTAETICSANAYALETCNALSSLNQTWEPVFARSGAHFAQPTLTFVEGRQVRTACGTISGAVGPFYCPADQTINIDVRFYDQLAEKLGAGGDFARYYVVAHEYGHHIQTITGVSDRIRRQQRANPARANQLQVSMELQADCLAGVWAGKNRNLIEPGDFEVGMNAAAAIGDDRLTGGQVSPENFTHGTSRQRMDALRLGMENGDENLCAQFLRDV